MMKVALLGAGKTGSKVIELLGEKQVMVFNRTTKLTKESLLPHDIVISFLPGQVFLDSLTLLVESRLPVVTGSTGFKWPDKFSEQLKDLDLTWITANNFSLGMVLIKQMISILGQADNVLENAKFEISETHHTSKLDAPSGTALSWQNWLGQPVSIESKRIDDVIGEHHLTLKTKFEELQLSHSAENRAIFANGAIWAAKQILAGHVQPGLNEYTDIVTRQLVQRAVNSDEHIRE